MIRNLRLWAGFSELHLFCGFAWVSEHLSHFWGVCLAVYVVGGKEFITLSLQGIENNRALDIYIYVSTHAHTHIHTHFAYCKALDKCQAVN